MLKRMMLKLSLLNTATVMLLEAIGLGVAPMPSVVMAQESKLPPCLENVHPWDNCKGSRRYTNGIYVGEWKDGKRNGDGGLTLATGETFVGEWKDDKRNGKGNLTLATGETYAGEWKDDKRNGKGTAMFADGRKYVGEWKDNKFNGKGVLTLSDGETYAGEWKDDKRDGKGTVTFSDGRKYVGEFRDNKLNGKGVLTFSDGGKYVGEFKDSKLNGKGTATYADGGKYVGEWKDDKRNGKGNLTLATGETYVGQFRDGNFVGGVANQELVAMEKEGGVYVVPVRLNGAITLNAVIDSGAADVSIPSDVVSTLIRTKTISEEDFLGIQTYVLADGSKVPSPRFRIRSLKVGNKTIENVPASIASGKADILLGQSFLSRFKSWSIDNDRHVLILRLP